MNFEEARKGAHEEGTKRVMSVRKTVKSAITVLTIIVLTILGTIWLSQLVVEVGAFLRSLDDAPERTVRSSPEQRRITYPTAASMCSGVARTVEIVKGEDRPPDNPDGRCDLWYRVHEGKVTLHASDGRTRVISKETPDHGLDRGSRFNTERVTSLSPRAKVTIMLCPVGSQIRGWACG